MPDTIATMMIMESLRQILDELKGMRVELRQLHESSRQATDERPRREPAPTLARFPPPSRRRAKF